MPASLTTSGTFKLVSLAASSTPWAIISHLIIPPNILTKIPLVVRLAGTNFQEGKNILDKSGLKILSASDLNDAAKKIVEAIK